jgi:hypothetical protein
MRIARVIATLLRSLLSLHTTDAYVIGATAGHTF